MLSSRYLGRCGVVAVLLGLAAPAHAQATGSLEAFRGYYRPFGRFDPVSIYDVALPSSPSGLSGATWGGSGHLSIGRFGVVGQVATAASHSALVGTPDGPRGPTEARVVVATLLGQYDVSPAPRLYQIWVNAGPGFVRHDGDAYRPYGSPTSFAGAVGLTVAVPIVAHLEITANATSLFYMLNVPISSDPQANGSIEHGNQRDALVHLGLAWTHF